MKSVNSLLNRLDTKIGSIFAGTIITASSGSRPEYLIVSVTDTTIQYIHLNSGDEKIYAISNHDLLVVISLYRIKNEIT